MQRLLSILFLLAVSYVVTGQTVWMHPNAGQWDDRIDYKVELTNGEMYIEDNGFTVQLTDQLERHNHSEKAGEDHFHEATEIVRNHVFRMRFTNASPSGEYEVKDKSSFYRNYLLGNDKSKWVSELYSSSEILTKDLYDGIDLRYSGKSGNLKYDLIVSPNTDPSKIQWRYEGQNELYLDEDGNLHVVNRFGEMIEHAPTAWTIRNKKKVKVRFVLEGNSLRYDIENYDQSDTLVIDPDLTFSTFSGSAADNWGFTACPDGDGNVFGGGVVFGLGYPVTVGAFDTTFNGGTVDVGITKFTADGSALIFSTHIGGVIGSETPNSIVAADNGELYIFGVTSSSDFPMAGNPFDNSYNGGPNIPNTETNSLGFTNGSDLYVARLNPTGTTLLSSTYVGGSDTDGINVSNLKFNYGDQFRGEIILDDQQNVYVASMTRSADFPTVAGPQGALSGTQDAVIFKMPPNLSSLIWSTYFGGSGSETGNSVQVSSTGEVYVAGGTDSGSMPFNFGFDQTYDGSTDGYLARFNGANGGILSGTYIGANEYDQAYFVQLDIDDRVYVLGQTETNLGVDTPFGVANSGQFIWKFDPNLASLQWRTMIGAGSGHVEMSPTAFLVSDCYDIYLSGWGGVLNANPNVSQAVNSSTNGFPVTVDAFQSATNGSNFYIAVLGQDASILKYATYMGGLNSSSNHVDGGTSRFDKAGRIYHAVCGACGGNPTGFTTTVGAYSPTNQSSNCNMAVFKFELSTIEAVVSNPDPLVCLPDPVLFNNNSANGNAFYWDFGDGTTSTEVNPSHVYPGAGDYTVSLLVVDTNGCFSPDSIEFIVSIGAFQGGVVEPPGPICPNEPYQLEAFGGTVYEWSPAQFLDDPTSATPTAIVSQTTDFSVIISDTCGVDTVSVTLPVFLGGSAISNDTSICIGNTVDLFVNGGSSYSWTPPDYLDDPLSSNPICTPTNDVTYNVEIVTANGCVLNESVSIDVYYTPPVPIMDDTLYLCEGNGSTIEVSGGDTYFWYPDFAISTTSGSVVEVNPPINTLYYCDFTNACGTVTDSIWVEIVQANIIAGRDTIICPGETAELWAQGGVEYYWYPGSGLNQINTSLVAATPIQPTTYYVIGTDANGCVDTDSVFVDLYPLAFIQTNPDVYSFIGDQIQLSATSTTSGIYVWSPSEHLTCVACPNPTANPDENYTYIVSYTDENGCSASDTVRIYYDPILYVPNTFTPNDDEHNQVFAVKGGNFDALELNIYNRWGEIIHTITSIDENWDGTYKGQMCQDGTYTWKATLIDLQGEEHLFTGHINLIR